MRTWRVCLLVVLAAAAIGCANTPRGGAGVMSGDLVLAAAGRADSVIAVAPDAGVWEKHAVEDLAHYIRLMTGGEPLIATTAEAIEAVLRGDQPVIVVGSLALETEPALNEALQRVAKPNPFLRADAIVLRRDGSRLFVAGTNDESHYYAAAELLRRWGCRFYLPTEFGEYVPRRAVLSVGKLDYAYAPPFEVRQFWYSWLGDTDGFHRFSRRNGVNGLRVWSSHALDRWVGDLPDEAKVDGVMSIAGDATADHVAAKVEEFFSKGQDISLAIEDRVYATQSPEDRRLQAGLYDKYFMVPSLSDPFLVMYNKISERLMAKYPQSQSKIGFLAYMNLTIPPQTNVTAAAPLVAYLAPIDIDPIHHMDDPQSPPRQEYREMVYRWAEVMQGRVVIYDYDQGMLVWRDLPNPSIQSIRHDIHHYRKAGILGIDTESRGAYATTFLNLYLRSRLYWDPDLDVDAELAEFYKNFYGPAAAPMRQYWTAINDAWENTIVTEHEHFVAPAIYTPELMAKLRRHIADAERAVAPLLNRRRDRLEALHLERMKFQRLAFDVLDNYMTMTQAVATEGDYAKAVEAGDRGLAAREALTDMSGIFTTYRKIGENGYAWWPGEVQHYRELVELVDGTRGTLISRLPLEWAFRRDPNDTGLPRGWAYQPADLSYWRANAGRYDLDSRKDYPTTEWETLRTDLYMQAQGVRHPDRQSYTGHAWYRTEVTLTAEQLAGGGVHLFFPGIFNESWLYVNGHLVEHRPQDHIWWQNDYRFQWDIDLTGKLRAGVNSITVRLYNPHHFGGIFRRPILYRPTAATNVP